MSVKINIDWKEVYKMLCENCRQKFKKYVKEKLLEEVVDNMFKE